jgi:starch synthase (maltosyl-transferring)
MEQLDNRKRVVIESLRPQIDSGQFPIKRTVGEKVNVQAYIFCDGHDKIHAELLFKHVNADQWSFVEMTPLVNDEWIASFEVVQIGGYSYTIRAWPDRFATWQEDLNKKYQAGQDVKVDLIIGAELVAQAASRAGDADADKLGLWAEQLNAAARPGFGVHDPEVDTRDTSTESRVTSHGAVKLAIGTELTMTMRKYPDRSRATTYMPELPVWVSSAGALFSAWYEVFPRSCGKEGAHGTLADCQELLANIAKLGFDVVYLPPIHPIGSTHRKGRDNSPQCGPEDPGSPWAIGSAEGGHKSIHPKLGTLEDFRNFVADAEKNGLQVALDLAYQCSPDHPYVKEHPEWFSWRPDGTVQHAENPPKKYEDIIPINFETEDWQALWEELKSIVLFWIEQGVRIFRVDNPHTKPFAFWHWLVAEVRHDYPDVIFLAEAFTRPNVMQRLAKVGFDQSYTYFTWRNTKYELTEYLTGLTQTGITEYLRPNFWTNTPDILPQYLQYGGRPAFIVRLVLAATLSSNYGIYGPAFELCVSEAIEGKEEYLNSEKYEIKNWNRNKSGNIRAVIERVNRTRRENPSLQQIHNLSFFAVDNDMILCYGKKSDDLSNITIMLVNLDPYHTQSGWVSLPLDEMQIDPSQLYLLHDQLSDDKYIWQGPRNYVELDPRVMPAHILCLRKHLRRETDFDYFM